jgi:hypothetical protein
VIAGFSRVLLRALGALLGIVAVAGAAEPPTRPISIYLHAVDNNSNTPVDALALTDKYFYIGTRVTPVVKGSHELAVLLYDPTGRQVMRSVLEQEQRGPDVSVGAGYYFKADDSVGRWRIVALLDGAPVSERWVQVSARRSGEK